MFNLINLHTKDFYYILIFHYKLHYNNNKFDTVLFPQVLIP